MVFTSHKVNHEANELQRMAKHVLRMQDLLDIRASKLIATISQRTGMDQSYVEHKIKQLANGVNNG